MLNLPETGKRRFAIVGYSTRALAEAVADLGCEVVAIDHFCDRDTAQAAHCIAVADWPNGIVDAATELDIDGILLAGGMENLPAIVQQLFASGKLLGLTPAMLAKVRDIEFLSTAAKAAAIRFPVTQAIGTVQDQKDWLWKPHSSAGGMGIRSGRDRREKHFSKYGYWQRLIRGRSIGVACLVSASDSFVIGATQSLTSDDSQGPEPFIYRGSIGPMGLTSPQLEGIARLCDRIAAETSHAGWLQFDFIEADDQQLWLLECNPRWTAGMEILHISGQANMAQLHLETCLWASGKVNIRRKYDIHAGQSAVSAELQGFPKSGDFGYHNFGEYIHGKSQSAGTQSWDRWAGKAIYYAEGITTFTPALRELLEAELRNWSACRSKQDDGVVTLGIADIPAGEQVFETGKPVLTLRVLIDRKATDSESVASEKLISCLQQGSEIVRRNLHHV